MRPPTDHLRELLDAIDAAPHPDEDLLVAALTAADAYASELRIALRLQREWRKRQNHRYRGCP